MSFLAEKYILREGNKVLKEGEINERLFEELNRAQIRKAIFIADHLPALKGEAWVSEMSFTSLAIKGMRKS